MSQTLGFLNKPDKLLKQKIYRDKLDGDDLEYSSQLEDHLDCIERRFKNNDQNMEKSKKRINNSLNLEIAALAKLCKQEETDLVSRTSLINTLKKRMCSDLKHLKHFRHSYSVTEKCKIQYLYQTGVTMVSPATIKKCKKQKHQSNDKILHISKGSSLHTQHKPHSHDKIKKSRKYLHGSHEYSNGSLAQDSSNIDDAQHPEQKDAHKIPLHCSEDNGKTSPKIQNSRVKAVCFNQSPVQEASCSADNSQDLFITQKTFQPVYISSGNSYNSPPLGQEQCASTLESMYSYSHSEVPQWFSRVQDAKHQHNIASVNNSIILKEVGTQTDDEFSYLSLQSFLKKKKVFEHCSEKPLDLTLPTRIRATSEYAKKNPKDDDVLITGVQPVIKAVSPKLEARKISLSQIGKYDEVKYIQTVLNSSYYLKGKGEQSEKIQMTPILKPKPITKLRLRKRLRFQRKR